MARNLPHDALTRVLCNLSGDLNLVEMALGTCSHWHRLGKDGALWKALGYARWGGGEGRMFKGINFWPIEIARDCFVERATGKVLRSAEVESLSVGGLLGERRPFRRVGQIQMHSSGLALTSMGGKVMLLNFNKMAHCLASFVVNLVCDLVRPALIAPACALWGVWKTGRCGEFGTRGDLPVFQTPHIHPSAIDFRVHACSDSCTTPGCPRRWIV